MLLVDAVRNLDAANVVVTGCIIWSIGVKCLHIYQWHLHRSGGLQQMALNQSGTLIMEVKTK